MTRSLEHRGPDDAGFYSEGPMVLGHRRLAVIDLSRNGRQPMSNEDGSVWIVYNGEVYNFSQLKTDFRLVEKGHEFRSRTDTEVLVHLYEELGPSFVEHLNGMFALAIWDAKKRQLHLMRDRFGIKPLFFAEVSNSLVFGSEIKALLCDPRIERRLNPQALHDYLTFDYVPGVQTMFAGIEPVPPANCLTIELSGEVSWKRYWELDSSPQSGMTTAVAEQRAGQLLEEALTGQLTADVPIGVLLSGGLDSSSIVALMRGKQSDPIRTYAVGFAESSYDERRYARMVASACGTRHAEVVVTPDRVEELLTTCLQFIDEPYADGSAIPTYCVCERAAEDVTVVLSGEGGDEAFVGYDTYAAFKAAGLARRIPGWFRNHLLRPLVDCLPVSTSKLSFEFRLKRFLGGLDLPPVEAHLWWRIVLNEAQKLKLYTPDFLERFVAEEPLRHFSAVAERATETDDLGRLLRIDTGIFLPGDLMIKNDRMSMAHSIEARVPFTDVPLMEFLASVPSHIKYPRFRRKHLLRLLMAGKLPRAVLSRKKVGLEMPYSTWLRGPLLPLLKLHCGPDRTAQTQVLRSDGITRLIDEHVSGQFDHGRALWGLLNFMIWSENRLS